MPSPGAQRPLLLGHRGARATRAIPENTTASFDQALADGCDGFEFDVRLTHDGKAVICHDAECDGIEIAHSQARDLPRLPRLEDVLARYEERAFLDIELKVAGLECPAVELLRARPPRRGYVVSSFLTDVLRTLHHQDAAVPLGLICETKAELRAWSALPLQFVIPHHSLVDRALIGELRSAGKSIFVWTVNDAADMRRFRDWSVEGIISDSTGLLCRTLGTREQRVADSHP